MTSLRIATTQPNASADVRRNGEAVRRLLREAAVQGARLVHFPEGYLSGYAKEEIADWADVDWAAVRDELTRVSETAAELGIWVVLGSAHPLTEPNRPHNSLYVISDEGRLVDRYDKRFCSHTEISDFHTPGSRPVVFEVDGVRFGCALCIEVNFPELFAEYERLGVDCVLLSAYPADAVLHTKAVAHAAINNYWLSLSVPAQSADLMPSAVVAPDGSTLAETTGDDLTVADLDSEQPDLHVALRLARPWRAAAREGGIYEARRVDDPRSTDRTRF